jgi:hypothetical protein
MSTPPPSNWPRSSASPDRHHRSAITVPRVAMAALVAVAVIVLALLGVLLSVLLPFLMLLLHLAQLLRH